MSTQLSKPYAAAILSESATNRDDEKTIPFLRRLTDMLRENGEVISFTPGHQKKDQVVLGKIIVHDRHKVESEVLPRYFNHSSFASLRRQLNYFSFTRIGKGRQRGATYCNEAVIHLDDIIHLKRRSVSNNNSNNNNGGNASNSYSSSSSSSSNNNNHPNNNARANNNHNNNSVSSSLSSSTPHSIPYSSFSSDRKQYSSADNKEPKPNPKTAIECSVFHYGKQVISSYEPPIRPKRNRRTNNNNNKSSTSTKSTFTTHHTGGFLTDSKMNTSGGLGGHYANLHLAGVREEKKSQHSISPYMTRHQDTTTPGLQKMVVDYNYMPDIATCGDADILAGCNALLSFSRSQFHDGIKISTNN